MGGAVFNHGTLVLDNVRLRDNRAIGGDGGDDLFGADGDARGGGGGGMGETTIKANHARLCWPRKLPRITFPAPIVSAR